MPYERILTLIDEYLDRLKAVRTLLAVTDPPASRSKDTSLPLLDQKFPKIADVVAIPERASRNSELHRAPPSAKDGKTQKVALTDRSAKSPDESGLQDVGVALPAVEAKQERQRLSPGAAASSRRLKAPARSVNHKPPEPVSKVKAVLVSPHSPGAALGGLVPSGPVFIPVEKLRVRSVVRPVEEDLTAEVLSQRWTRLTKQA